jgi:TonB family protein
MIKFTDNFNTLVTLALATLCAAAAVYAQEAPAPTNSPAVILDHKEAARMVLSQVPPDYPPVAKVNYLAGPVQLQITVDNTGKVTNSHVVEGDAVLADAALAAARHWLYRPLSTAYGPEGFITAVQLKFDLTLPNADLPPPRAESDFLRQVKPPRVVRPPDEPASGDTVHFRVLVNDQGQVDDIIIFSPMSSDQFEAARRTLKSWTFRPARWGNIAVASYLDVNIPVGPPPEETAAGLGGR